LKIIEEVARNGRLRELAPAMNATARRSYDHRIRAAVVATGNPHLFPKLKIPSGTARTWIRRGSRKVVAAANDGPADVGELRAELEVLRAKAEMYLAIASVFLVVMKVLGLKLDNRRLPDGPDKAMMLRVLAVASRHVPQRRLLRLLGLSPSRYHAWKRRSLVCQLDDESSCPRSHPTRLTAVEIQAVKEYVVGEEFRHLSVRALSLHAQRKGKAFACASTWRRLIRERGWLRPRTRHYPARPKVGVRATQPNEWWHIDLTVLRTTSGARVFLHAVIDNFSRKILSWEVAARVAGSTTTQVVAMTAEFLEGDEVQLMADSGAENVNMEVEGYLEGSTIRRVLAQLEVVESNSMIEALRRSLKHQWPYLHGLETIEQVRKLVEFYVEQHNTVMPHAAFDGQTPDEVYFGVGDGVPARLAEERHEARRKRVSFNRSRPCGACSKGVLTRSQGGASVEAA
jgi:transposase InsO family protein